MDCERHPGQETIGKCIECGKGICPMCIEESDDAAGCPTCHEARVARIAASMGASVEKVPRRARKPAKEPRMPAEKDSKKKRSGPELLDSRIEAPTPGIAPPPSATQTEVAQAPPTIAPGPPAPQGLEVREAAAAPQHLQGIEIPPGPIAPGPTADFDELMAEEHRLAPEAVDVAQAPGPTIPPPAYAPPQAPAPPVSADTTEGALIAYDEFGRPVYAVEQGKKAKKAKKEKLPKAPREKPVKAAREKPPKAKKEKTPRKPRLGKGEFPVVPGAPVPPGLTMPGAPPADTVPRQAPPIEQPPAYAVPQIPPIVYEQPQPDYEAPPPPPADEQAPPAYSQPSTFETPDVMSPAPSVPDMPRYESPPAVGATEPSEIEQMPGEFAPWEIEAPPLAGDVAPAEGPPPFQAPAEEKPFDVEGIPEQVRPENVNPEDFKLPPEYQELMGAPTVDSAGGEREAEAPPSIPPHASPSLDVEDHEWPFDDVPSIPADAPATSEWGAPAAPVESWQGTEEQVESSPAWSDDIPAIEAAPPAPTPPAPLEYVDIPNGEDDTATVDDEEQPPAAPPVEAVEGPGSFFFEENVKKKEKDQKGDSDSFWE
ncbi:MAG: hypothetical protein CVT63_06925 [Candidatus Anoxymicrobium japonicum]|uniref:B box-type domain-containing protein n=1 Tax=Candidatus Anoxymicrobium japonicum TaxID=2013648 RepID=A0A2N3G4L6_9ACTN|nr:MAG: hypothetical protein CVT63_06925 [Candidatus Anoxymicrobium japonicum]